MCEMSIFWVLMYLFVAWGQGFWRTPYAGPQSP